MCYIEVLIKKTLLMNLPSDNESFKKSGKFKYLPSLKDSDKEKKY